MLLLKLSFGMNGNDFMCMYVQSVQIEMNIQLAVHGRHML